MSPTKSHSNQKHSKKQFGHPKAQIHHYYDDSDDDFRPGFSQRSKHNKSDKRSKSLPPINQGSDTCTFETMEDQHIAELFRHERRLVDKEKSSGEQGGKSSLPKSVTFPMDNLGNTCFFNSVMQCLTHTLPFYQLCMSQEHVY